MADHHKFKAKNGLLVKGANDNSGKADFALNTGGNATVSLHGTQVQMGSSDMNWNGKISYISGSGVYLSAWDIDLRLTTSGGASAGARNIRFAPQASGGSSTERMIITGAGKVGIGTSSPVYKFEVSDGARTGVFNPNSTLDGFFIGTYQNKPLIFGTNDTQRMRLTPSGNLGIGTTSPSEKLTVSGNIQAENATFTGSGDVTVKIIADTDNVTETDNPTLGFSQDGNTTGTLFVLGLEGNANTAFPGSIVNAPYIHGNVSAAPVQIANKGKLVADFDSTAANAALTVTKFSSISGTSNGSTILNLKNYMGSATTDGDLNQQKSFIDFQLLDANTNEVPQVRIGAEVGENGDANSQIKEGSGAFVVYTNDAESTSGDAGASLTEKLRVDYQGNVGIGTASPAAKLDVVNGSLHLSTGYNLSWGGNYNTGKPTISATGSAMIFYPTGNTDGEVIRIDADGIDMNSHNLTEVNNITATGLTTLGRTASDRGSTSDTNTALVVTSRGVDHTSSRTNVLRLQRDGTSGVIYAGIADIDLERWETSGVAPRTAMHFRLAHNNLSSYNETAVPTVMTLRSNGHVGIGTSSPSATLHVTDGGTSGETTFSANGRIIMRGDGVLDWGGAADYGTLTWDTGRASIYAKSGKDLWLGAHDTQGRVKIDSVGRLNIVNNALLIESTTALDKSGNYMVMYDGSGAAAIYAGNTSDNRNYYQSDNHRWRSDNSSTNFAELSATGLHVGGITSPTAKLTVSGNVNFNVADLYSNATQAHLNIGRSSAQRFNMYVTDAAGYIRYYQDETDETDHSVHFEIQSSSTGTNKFYFNKSVDITGGVTAAGNSIVVGSSQTAGKAFLVQDSGNVDLMYALNTGEVVIPHNYLYVSASQGAYFTGPIRARGSITNDGGNDLSISSGSSNITFDNKNLSSIGTISSGAITSSGIVSGTAFVGGLYAGATGAPDARIWAVSADYSDYGIFYNEGNPDTIEFKWNNVVKAYINMETGLIDSDTGFSVGGTTVINSSGQYTGGLNPSSLTIGGTTVIDAGRNGIFSGVQGTGVGVDNTSSSTKRGIALYGGYASATNPTYGIMFTGTSGSGTHGFVTGDWATYFTMNNSANRGWIFRDQGNSSNVASISNSGKATFTEIQTYTTDGASNTNKINLGRGGAITFYGNANHSHAIMGRNASGSVSDNIRINSYAGVFINLDSNSNNTSNADFIIGRHGSGTGTMSTLFTVGGENGNLTLTGDINLPTAGRIYFGGTTNFGVGVGGHNNRSVYVDTIESGTSTDPLELVYYQGSSVKIGPGVGTKPLYAGSYHVDGKKFIDMPSNSGERGPWNPIVSSIRGSGRMLYTDEDFTDGMNNVNVYNNSGGGTVTITREDATTNSGGNAPNSSGKVLKIYWNGGTASPNRGGFYQSIPAEDNHTFVQVFQAKLPSGSTLHINENSQGTNNTSYWLTDTAGTGKWEWYARISHCGNSGTFSSGGHISVSGPSSAFSWYLASCTCFDITETPKLWSAWNDGSGSGLDADTVDGLHASSFARTVATAGINMQNHNITNVNMLTFNDPGVAEGIKWNGGNQWQIYESPDNQTNASGNLQFTSGSGNGTRRMTIDTSGNLNLATGSLQIDGTTVIDSNRNLTNINTLELKASNSSNKWIAYTHTDNTYRINYNGAGADEFIIDSGGRVGIGTTSLSSSYKLNVSGNVDMNNTHIHYANEVHFNAGTRFKTLNTSTTLHRSNHASASFIALDTNGTIRGYVAGNSDSGHSVGLLDQGGNWAVRHINDQGTIFYSDGGVQQAAIGRDLVPGNYGSMVVNDFQAGWAGYSINNQWVFMADGATNAGIYNDTDNEWSIRTYRNGSVELMHNGSKKLETRSDGVKVTGNLIHDGLTPTSGTDIDQLYTVIDSLTLTTSWQDTSINSSELATGTYILQMHTNDNGNGGAHYNEYYSGIISWYGSSTNSGEVDEIVLHRAGHAPNASVIHLRTQRHASGGDNLRLQIKANYTRTAASNYTFKFRRMI